MSSDQTSTYSSSQNISVVDHNFVSSNTPNYNDGDYNYQYLYNVPPPNYYLGWAQSDPDPSSTSVEEHAKRVDDFLKKIARKPVNSNKWSKDNREKTPFSPSPEYSRSSCSRDSHSHERKERSARSKNRRSTSLDLKSSPPRKRSHSGSSLSRKDRGPLNSLPEKRKHDSGSSEPKKPRSNKDALSKKLAELTKQHEDEYAHYSKFPQTHPKYEEEKNVWREYIGSTSRTISKEDSEAEWFAYWEKLLLQFKKHTWKVKKRKYLKELGVKRPPSSDTSPSSSSPKKSSKKPKKRKKKKEKDHQLSPTLKTLPGRKPDEDCTKNHKDKELSKSNEITDTPSVYESTKDIFNIVDNFECEADPIKPIDQNMQLSEEAFRVVKTLKQLGSKLGLYEDAVSHLYQQFYNERAKGKNLCLFIDKDAQMFFNVLNSKLKGSLQNKDLSLIQKAILTETQESLDSFLKNLEEVRSRRKNEEDSSNKSPKNSRDPTNLNVHKLAIASQGKSCTETIKFLSNILTLKNINLPNEKLMELYLAVTSHQARINADENSDSKEVFSIDVKYHESSESSNLQQLKRSVYETNSKRNHSDNQSSKNVSSHSEGSKHDDNNKKASRFVMTVKKKEKDSNVSNIKSKMVSKAFAKDAISEDE